MNIWPFSPRETRQQPYSDAIIAQLVGTASGTSASPSTTGIAEICAGIWGRALASAKVLPEGSIAARALTPDVLEKIGRALVLNGEALFEIQVRGGGVVLDQSCSWQITGEAQPWIYRADFAAPSTILSRTRAGDRMLHVRIGADAAQPWRGIGPIERAATTLRLAANMESKLGDESGGPVGSLIPTPHNKNLDQLQQDITGLKGKVALVESTSAGWGDGETGAPRQDWQPKRVGFNPPVTLDDLRDGVNVTILAACGVPTSMLGRADSGAAREHWRQFLHGTISPVSLIISPELSEKLETPDLSFNFDSLFASDLSGRARSFQSMVGGGMQVEQAAALAGLLVED